MLLPPFKPAKIKTRVDFDPAKFRALVWAKGLDVIWEQAAQCPCRRATADVTSGFTGLTLTVGATPGNPRTDCPTCNGKGYYRHSAQEIRVEVTGMSRSSEAYKEWGQSARGMAYITSLPENILSFQDRITALNSSMIYHETLQRETSPEGLRVPIVTRAVKLSTGDTTVSVLHLRRADLAGNTGPGDELTPGVDFEVDIDGKIDWTLGDGLGTAPVVGAWYSVSYFGRPRYVVIDFPYSTRDTQVKFKQPVETHRTMPCKSLARLEFLGGDQNGY